MCEVALGDATLDVWFDYTVQDSTIKCVGHYTGVLLMYRWIDSTHDGAISGETDWINYTGQQISHNVYFTETTDVKVTLECRGGINNDSYSEDIEIVFTGRPDETVQIPEEEAEYPEARTVQPIVKGYWNFDIGKVALFIVGIFVVCCIWYWQFDGGNIPRWWQE